jgi:regulator of cell morphogenesis and NO signaling
MTGVIAIEPARQYPAGVEGDTMADACACGSGTTTTVLDVREMAPRIRHPKIFETFDALAPGQAFILVNDHEPKPLFYQFLAERLGTFRWRYLEEGPETWRVEIAKVAPAVTATQTVEEVAHRGAAALDVLKRMGINHCCGAQLSLGEAAAAAGVPIDALLRALDEAVSGAA